MELRLYRHLRNSGLPAEVDFSDKSTQEKLESWNEDLVLDGRALDRVKQDLKKYNSYLAEPVKLRYYQILALYFTELYFSRKDDPDFEYAKESAAYWMATGSGKTMIMHLNLLQYLRHLKRVKNLEVVMTTPGVNLIQQHERELTPFLEWLNNEHKGKIDLTIDTTSALLNRPDDFFDFPATKGFYRLVLVDEAHIGLSSGKADTDGEFLKLRKRLNIQNSFLFEYSATFHNLKSSLEREYEKSIIYDYNYNLFYKDGYGKDFYFQQVGEDVLDKGFDDNLHRNLEVITDKLEVWHNTDYSAVKNLFSMKRHPSRPLIAFMGNTVNARSSNNEDDEVSDIQNILKFLADLTETDRRQYSSLFHNDYSGNLTLTRNPEVEDEILLSYGNGKYWGIVNVGNGPKFINDLPFENVVKKSHDQIVVSDLQRLMFKNIDDKESPINMLIGSRKFAEGWNCFRLSLIGLINLGSSKGNKIIQIFGRGVRLFGLKNDGKRTFETHAEDYFRLKSDYPPQEANIRKLETLCVFSLKRSYLETFTKSVFQELEIHYPFEIEVTPSIIHLGNGTELKFEEYRKRLPVMKLSKVSIKRKKAFLSGAYKSVKYKFYQEGELKEKQFTTPNFKLDYRPDKSKNGKDIRGTILNNWKQIAPYLNHRKLQERLVELEEMHGLQLFSSDGEAVIPLRIEDLVMLSEEILYKEELNLWDIDFVENALSQILYDLVRKLHNKINWQINSSNYAFGEKLEQSTATNKGDFIEKYYLVKSFSTTYSSGASTKFYTQAQLNKQVEEFENKLSTVKTNLSIDADLNHIYAPLLREPHNRDEEEKLKISPDKLNSGEKKFVEDAASFFKENSDRFKDYDIWLMRNVESLKSIGIYLDDDTQVFHPDFLLWIIGKEKVYLIFIDPKGQQGTINWETLKENEKVRIADKLNHPTLEALERELAKTSEKPVVLNSFLLLRDSSTFGKNNSDEWKKKNMIDKHILRLDWSEFSEKGSRTDKSQWTEGKIYLEWMMEKVGI